MCKNSAYLDQSVKTTMFKHIKSHGSHLGIFTSETLSFGLICKKDPNCDSTLSLKNSVMGSTFESCISQILEFLP
jgi:hypothetical protein